MHDISWILREDAFKHNPSLNKEITLHACYETANAIYEHEKFNNTINNRIHAHQDYGGLIGLQDVMVHELLPAIKSEKK